MAKVYCKTVGPDQVAFYLQVRGKEHFLCKQRYYGSMWQYFAGGVPVQDIFTRSGKHSHAIREVKLKLPSYIQYVEREEDVQVLERSIAKKDAQIGFKKRYQSKTASYNWRNDELAEIV